MVLELSLTLYKFQAQKIKDLIPETWRFYGVNDEIWQLDYLMVKKTLFKCDWVDDRGVCTDNLGFTVVDLNLIALFWLVMQSKCFM